ncbi:hypothetical protein ACVWYG_002297 [Pedobacter sp. UYEF25]
MVIHRTSYKASLGIGARIITIAITLLFSFIIGSQFIWFEAANSVFFVLPLVFGIYIICLLLMPLRYTITDNEILVERIFSKVHIKKENIKSLQQIGISSIAGTIRTFGNGGLFCFTGHFVNASIGKMTWFVTRKDTLILLYLNDGKRIVISPNEPKEFIKVFKLRCSP